MNNFLSSTRQGGHEVDKRWTQDSIIQDCVFAILSSCPSFLGKKGRQKQKVWRPVKNTVACTNIVFGPKRWTAGQNITFGKVGLLNFTSTLKKNAGQKVDKMLDSWTNWNIVTKKGSGAHV